MTFWCSVVFSFLLFMFDSLFLSLVVVVVPPLMLIFVGSHFAMHG